MITAYIPFEIKGIMEKLDIDVEYDIEYYMKLHLIEYCDANGYYSEQLKDNSPQGATTDRGICLSYRGYP